MSLSRSKITELAPDQESLNAAHKLLKRSQWPTLARRSDLVWGECQGSGANPYRTVFDQANTGYKCTCPSRKFPCKHVLALMWMYVDDPGPFADGEVPQWVTDWLGRRRSTDGASATKPDEKKSNSTVKTLAVTQSIETVAPIDPKLEAKRKAASDKRAAATRESISAGLEELQQWLSDQVRGGLSSLINDAGGRCRTIAARLVDAKAQGMASRLDELPSRLKQVPSESRVDALLQELGRIVLLARAWKAFPNDAEITRLVGSSETRDSVLANTESLRVTSVWEVAGEQVVTRRDGLVSHSTWLLNLHAESQFALLLDFFPASLGKRGSAFQIGEQFEAELVYYPARLPLRAVIAERSPGGDDQSRADKPWPQASKRPMEFYRDSLSKAPWTHELPLLLPAGRIAETGNRGWWQAEDSSLSLPLANKPSRCIAGLSLHQTAALWDGMILTLLSGQSDWGRWSSDG